ncbi:hypothetical protein MATL_G00023380 [Megalops atlanticus]|uniref:Chemokine interleukin-8-like domain-containing protein n=1 Tax=Megalops atlanticus TaxID=7932 RepID=A0A9D3THT3_MEGAT|nr:hypothetical protein MATL_G00023380 [Megalops atlanticus]
MPTYQTTRGFAILAIIAFIVDKTDGKMASCCTEVSRQEVTGPITGYRIQKWNPPCVKAVIFETAAGMVCSHWKEPWVLQKIRQFERARGRTVSIRLETRNGVISLASHRKGWNSHHLEVLAAPMAWLGGLRPTAERRAKDFIALECTGLA